jgi:predicted HAD superfamily Cof-like phosphohydrolase
MSVFADQKKFMESGDQTVGHFNEDQFNMYVDLIDEEYNKELKDAIAAKDHVEIFDALLDIVVVTIGAMHSLGVDAEGGWNEVMATNFAKIDPTTGKCRKREDGKILKPEGWVAPDLAKYFND